eukprot:c23477_g1_i1 orf=249-1475(-)
MAQVGGALLKSLVRGARQQQQPLCSHGAYSYISRRAMSRLFVGGLSFTTEEEGLRTAFSKFGEIVDTRIVTDRESGRSRGFGFVTFLSEEDADTAKQKMSGQFLDGRVIRVDRATPRPPPPRYDPPVSEPAEQATSQDWGSISSPIAAVPQNAGLAQASSSSLSSSAPFDSIGSSNGLPDLSTLASPNNTVITPSPPFSFMPASDPSPPTRASTKDTGPSFDFIDLDLSNLPPPDPNRLARRRPPRIRPSSMADYEFGYYMSETSKFPFNTNFETGFQKPKGPEYEFDFTDIREAAAIRKAEELAIKKAKEAGEAALMQAKETEEAVLMRDKEAAEVGIQQASDAADSSQSTLLADVSSHANLSSPMHTDSSAIPQASLDDSPNAGESLTAAVPEAQEACMSELRRAA